MPRLSLWKEGRHTNDFKFLDRRMSEMFTVGGTGIYVHKYLGPTEQNTIKSTSASQGSAGTTLTFTTTSDVLPGMYVVGAGIPVNTTILSKTASNIVLSHSTTTALSSGTVVKFYSESTKPSYINDSALNIQDLLLLENRDRKYDTSVYLLRGIYQVQDVTFDLSQFGMFLQTGTLFIVFHINDMVQTLGRKLMAGDVIELQHLKDYYPLDDTLPVALKRYYVISDCQNASEGYSQTWWPHLWRCKINPLTDSQEYKDILNQITIDNELDPTGGNITLGSVSSIINKYQEINDSIIRDAELNVPYSGYDTSHLYVTPTDESTLYAGDPAGLTADSGNITADYGSITTDTGQQSPQQSIEGWLTGDGLAPNGLDVSAGISFPTNPQIGDYALRTDYLPNRLFRFNGSRWVKIEDNVRTSLTPGPTNHTQRSEFINNTETYTNNSGNVNIRQSLSQALRPKADN